MTCCPFIVWKLSRQNGIRVGISDWQTDKETDTSAMFLFCSGERHSEATGRNPQVSIRLSTSGSSTDLVRGQGRTNQILGQGQHTNYIILYGVSFSIGLCKSESLDFKLGLWIVYTFSCIHIFVLDFLDSEPVELYDVGILLIISHLVDTEKVFLMVFGVIHGF